MGCHPDPRGSTKQTDGGSRRYANPNPNPMQMSVSPPALLRAPCTTRAFWEHQALLYSVNLQLSSQCFLLESSAASVMRKKKMRYLDMPVFSAHAFHGWLGCLWGWDNVIFELDDPPPFYEGPRTNLPSRIPWIQLCFSRYTVSTVPWDTKKGFSPISVASEPCCVFYMLTGNATGL